MSITRRVFVVRRECHRSMVVDVVCLAFASIAFVIMAGACSESPRPRQIVAPIPTETDYFVAPYAFHPTESSVVISFVPDSDRLVRVHYAEAGSTLEDTSPESTASAGKRVEVRLEGLQPGTVYEYEVRQRMSGEDPWLPGVRKSVRTARPASATGWRFAIGGDDHSVVAWAGADCGSQTHEKFGLLETFYQTQRQMVERGADFYINAGDTSNNHGFVADGCTYRSRDIGKGTVGVAGRGSAFREAQARWALWLHNNRVALESMPLFLAMGNHDGEQSFGNRDGDCRYFRGHPTVDDTHLSSEAARLALFPNPAKVYAGHSSGAYYSFTWGNAEFFILDVHKFGVTGDGAPYDGSRSFPETADDWTLGEEQLQWLEASLKKSDRRFKFLIAHHILGGMTTGNCYHYGRGSLNATDTGDARGAFLGEQQRVQELMVENGAQVFALGHDHVALAGQKLNPDGTPSGVHYITVGMLGYETPPSWVRNEEFIAHSDFNADGIADFELDDVDHGTSRDHGSTEKGHFSVTVEEGHADFCYIRTRKPAYPADQATEFCYRVDAKL